MIMKKFYLAVSLLATIMFLLSSCTKGEDPKVEASPASLDITSADATFTVTSNVKWTLSKSGDVNMSVSPTSGEAGSTVVTVSAYSVNTTQSVLSSTITVTGAGAAATVTVTQSPVVFTLSPEVLEMEAEESTKSIAVTSNTDWNVNGVTLPAWIKSVTPTATSGNGEIKVTVNKNTNRVSENAFQLRISYGGSMSKSVEIKQAVAPNKAPSKPSGLVPENNATGVSMMPTFKWEPSTDEEGDAISYSVALSSDAQNWKRISAGKATSVALPVSFGVLTPNTKYYYKVIADDGYKNGVTESDVHTFTVTDKRDVYADGDYVVYMESSKPTPVVMIFTGDGYQVQHYKYGGQFDKDVNAAIDGLFEVEPYKSYKEYFTVYKIAAYSNQTGITNKSTNDIKDTKFSLEWEGGYSTGISCNYDLVMQWVMKIPGIDRNVLKRGAIGVISNANVYAGTCASYSDGVSISMIPYLRSASSGMTNFTNVVVHEMGGHGFGRLGDEYQSYDEMASEERQREVLNFQNNWAYPFYLNLSIYPEMSKSLWAHFEGVEGYSHVGMFEGGGLYTRGIWRPEKISCMEDNRKYYNSPSRFYIVKRILESSGEIPPYSTADSDEVKAERIVQVMKIFLEKDVQKTDNTATKGWEGVPYDFIPLGRPVFIEVD